MESARTAGGDIFKKIRKRFFKIILFLALFVLLFDVLMFSWAYFESDISKNDNKWINESQLLNVEDFKNKSSVIMVHGFIGSPYDMKPLALELNKKGFRVVIPKLKGQTYSDKAYKRGKYKADYYIQFLRNLIEKEIKLTKKKPILIGFSMGGALSTILASENNIEKLILLAPFYKLFMSDDSIWKLTNSLSYITPLVPKSSAGKINKKSHNYSPGSYIISLSAFDTLGEITKIAKKSVDKIKVETLVFASKNDEVASYKQIVSMFKDKKNVKIIANNKSNHVLLYDFGKEGIISSICDFID